MASMSSLQDNFNDNSQGALWGNSYATGVATKAETSGMAVFTCGTSGTVSYAAYGSSSSYDLTSSAAYLQTNSMVSTSTNAQAFFKLYVDSNNLIQWVQEAGTIRVEKKVSGTTTTVLSGSYDYDVYRWLRIRETSGTTYFEYSSNGKQWTQFTSTPNPIAVTSLFVEFGAGTYQSETLPGFLAVDNFNTLPTANIDKSYLYKRFTGNEYIGLLDNVSSDFKIRQEINTSGSQLEIELAVAFAESGSTLETDDLVDESAGAIVTESGEAIVASSTYSIGSIPSLNDRIEVWEFSSNDPYGKLMFTGLVSKFRGNYSDNKVTVTVLSYGVQLDNYLVQILPEQTLTEFNVENWAGALDTIYPQWKSARNRIVGVGQTFQVLSDTEVTTFYALLGNTGVFPVTVVGSIYSGTPTSTGSGLGWVSRVIPANTSPTVVAFQFATPISLTGSTDYHIRIFNYEFGIETTRTVTVGYVAGGGYTSGARYTYNDSSGWSAPSGDIIFSITTSSGSIGNQFLSYDPSDIVRSLLDSFIELGGNLTYTADSIQDTNTTVSYTFKFNTYYEALQKCVELAPANWYFYVDPGTGVVYFKPKPTNISHTMILGSHINDLSLEYSLEDMVNTVWFSGGDTGGGENLLVNAANSASITNYGVWLDTPSDNRVTDEDTADILSQAIINARSEPKFKVDSIIVPSSVYDTTLFNIGELIGFGNFNSLVDSLSLQIMAIDYSPDTATLDLEVLPPTQAKRIEDIKRNLQKQETENNPDL